MKTGRENRRMLLQTLDSTHANRYNERHMDFKTEGGFGVSNHQEWMERMIAACERIGAQMKSRLATTVSDKEGHANFVTDMDVWVQAQLVEAMRAIIPGAGIIAEEAEENGAAGEGYCFVIDPIDGTQNFLCRMGHSAISVGLLQSGEILGGVVHDPFKGETFSAVRGGGAYLNGERLHVSTRDVRHSLVHFGTSPYHPALCARTFSIAHAVMGTFADVRRSGSAALDLCYVACGRCDAYFELILQPWDFAAGTIIVREAGGLVETIGGEALAFDRPAGILAAAPHALAPLRALIGEGKP